MGTSTSTNEYRRRICLLGFFPVSVLTNKKFQPEQKEHFHTLGQKLCKFIAIKESVQIDLEHHHGRRFNQHGECDVMWKGSIVSKQNNNSARASKCQQGPVRRKMVKFNPGLSQILSKVFLSDKMQLKFTK